MVNWNVSNFTLSLVLLQKSDITLKNLLFWVIYIKKKKKEICYCKKKKTEII